MSHKVALYVRKSREEENSTAEETLHDQELTLIRLCENRGYEYDIFKEVESSIKIDRPELIKLMHGIEQGKYNKLLITHIDRLGRDIGLLDDLKKLCIANNIIIETPDNTINFKDDNHDLMYGFSSVLADFEYKRIRHRLATGKVNTVSLRNRWIGSTAPFGYYYDKNNKTLKPHSEQFKVFRKMVDYSLEGYSFSEVAAILNDQGYRTQNNNRWTAGRVQKILKNRTYLGEAEYNSTRLDKKVKAIDCHEPLITEDEFATIQKLSAGRRNYNDKSNWGNIKTMLDGIVYCGVCKRRMSIQIVKKKSKARGDWSFYQARRCIHFDENGERCKNHGCKIDILENVLIENLDQYEEKLTIEYNKLEDIIDSGIHDEIKKKINDLQMEIKKQELKINKVTELFLDDVISREEHDKRRDTINQLKVNIENELNYLENKLANLDVGQMKKVYKQTFDNINIIKDETIPIEVKNKSLKQLVSRIELTKETQYSQSIVTIKYFDVM